MTGSIGNNLWQIQMYSLGSFIPGVSTITCKLTFRISLYCKRQKEKIKKHQLGPTFFFVASNDFPRSCTQVDKAWIPCQTHFDEIGHEESDCKQ